jgi:hypothetical protein
MGTIAIAAVFIEKGERIYWTVVQERSAMRATIAAADFRLWPILLQKSKVAG